MPTNQEPFLFLWSPYPWASKITAYLALRGISYTRCEMPITRPRPDLFALEVNYRRIHVSSLGRDIYCDTLILAKLEGIYQNSQYIHISTPRKGTDYLLEKLLEQWTDCAVFKAAAAAIPSEMDLMRDAGFQKDREELWGRLWSKEEQNKLRPKALADLRATSICLKQHWEMGRHGLPGVKDRC